MKKLIVILISAAVLTFASAALAQGPELNQGSGREKGQGRYTEIKDKVKEFHSEIKARNRMISANRLKINDIQAQINSQASEIKVKIEALRNNAASLDAGKISIIKQTLDAIKQHNKILGATQGKIQRKNLELKNARQKRMPEIFKRGLDDIIAVQEQRIDTLNKTLTDLKKLNEQLN
jgi:chromosome segregation ATPase